MSDTRLERVSALVDGELDRAEALQLLGEVADDPKLQQAWEQYHLIGDAAQGRALPRIPAVELFQRIHRAVESEPTLYRLSAFRAGALRPLAGLALAASVAVVAVLGVRSYVPDAGFGGGTVAQRDPAPPVSLASVREPASSFDPRLSRYLVNHSERAGHTMHGVLPYARIVAHDAGR
jgi:sigma-E factor negative regulatory protein RseA